MIDITTYLEPWFELFAADSALRVMQLSLLGLAGVLIFFLFYATRDIILRTHSFLYQLLCIVVVALLPGLGFLLYLLMRPARTIKERELEKMMRALLKKFGVNESSDDDEDDSNKVSKKQKKKSD